MSFSIETAASGVKYLRSSAITAKHGFATRCGGVSRHEHTASLNLAFGRGDDDDAVIENLRRFTHAVGVTAESVISRHQIHSKKVIYADETMCGEGYFKASPEGCDGYVTNKSGVTLGVKTADCVPILFEDSTAHVIGATHAGWRGTVSGIAGECVTEMVKLGAKTENIHAAIGPCIKECCYEVGDDFFESVKELRREAFAKKFVRLRDGVLYADIVGMNLCILSESGLSMTNIDVCEYCTCCCPELFFSHRYSAGHRGTMLSVICR